MESSTKRRLDGRRLMLGARHMESSTKRRLIGRRLMLGARRWVARRWVDNVTKREVVR
jgi:hypothetical protein